MKNKIIIPVTGPAVTYRLDIIKKAYPALLDYLILFTNKFSYSLYADYHDTFNFILMEDYQDDFSRENEQFPKYKTSDEYYKNITSFKGAVSPDISRFMFKYLMDNDIYNFIITETDFIFRNDVDFLQRFFNSVPKGTLYMPWMNEDKHFNNSPIWNNIQPFFPNITLEYEKPLRMCDGYLRGFHFKTKEDMNLFYNIYCEAVKGAITPESISYVGTKLYYTDYIVYTIMQIFEKQKNYKFEYMFNLTFFENYNLGIHVCRPEDTFYSFRVAQWEDKYKLDRYNVSSVEEYIKKNKNQLKHYYENHGYKVEATDTHIFTSIA